MTLILKKLRPRDPDVRGGGPNAEWRHREERDPPLLPAEEAPEVPGCGQREGRLCPETLSTPGTVGLGVTLSPAKACNCQERPSWRQPYAILGRGEPHVGTIKTKPFVEATGCQTWQW